MPFSESSLIGNVFNNAYHYLNGKNYLDEVNQYLIDLLALKAVWLLQGPQLVHSKKLSDETFLHLSFFILDPQNSIQKFKHLFPDGLQKVTINTFMKTIFMRTHNQHYVHTKNFSSLFGKSAEQKYRDRTTDILTKKEQDTELSKLFNLS